MFGSGRNAGKHKWARNFGTCPKLIAVAAADAGDFRLRDKNITWFEAGAGQDFCLHAPSSHRNIQAVIRRQHAVGSGATPTGVAPASVWGQMKTWVYVDGFNLYYGALKGTPYRWLDPVLLTTILLPQDHVVDRLRYFTARVLRKSGTKAPTHQRNYLKALSTLPEVSLHYGRFLARTDWCPLANLPVAGRRIYAPDPATLPQGDHLVSGEPRQILPVGSYPDRRTEAERWSGRTTKLVPDALVAEFHTTVEKGSDVNLAAYLLNDAWKGSFDVAVVISNDTDLVTPIRMVRTERSRPVFVVCPGRGQIAPKLKNVASHVRQISHAHLKAAQFPATLPGTAISKPCGW